MRLKLERVSALDLHPESGNVPAYGPGEGPGGVGVARGVVVGMQEVPRRAHQNFREFTFRVVTVRSRRAQGIGVDICGGL